jgi:hypothetical protein
MGASGKIYGLPNSGQYVISAYAASWIDYGIVATEGGVYLAGIAVDPDRPAESNFYITICGSTSLIRYSGGLGALTRTVVGTLPVATGGAPPSADCGNQPIYYRPYGVLWLVDGSGNLIQVQA